MLPKFSYVRPDKLEHAVTHLAADDAMIHAGGTDLLGCLRDEVITGGKVVSISALKDLAGITELGNSTLRIGALTTISEIADSALIRRKYPGLAMGASEVASPQLRNQGTIGGNLCQKPRCWYYRGDFHCRRKGGPKCFAITGENQFHAIFGHDNICVITHPSDTAPVLAALDARVQVTGYEGKRTIAVEDLHVRPTVDVQAETILKRGEIITHIDIPAPAANLYSSYRKIRARRAWDFALAGAALAMTLDGDRVVRSRIFLSGAAPVPWRSQAAEQILTGAPLTGNTIAKAARAAVADAKPLRQNRYKVEMIRGMLEEELHKARA